MGRRRERLGPGRLLYVPCLHRHAIFAGAVGRWWLSTWAHRLAGDPYYAVTHNGLDAMIERLLEEAQMLLADQPPDVSLASSRFEYMWKVGLAPACLSDWLEMLGRALGGAAAPGSLRSPYLLLSALLQVGLRDLHSGLKALDEVMVGFSEGIFTDAKLALVLLLVAGVLGTLALLLLLVRPFARSLRHESEMVAELLSQLPHELDVTGLVRAAVLRWASETCLRTAVQQFNAYLLAAGSHVASSRGGTESGRAAVGSGTTSAPSTCRAAGEEPDPADATDTVQEGKRSSMDSSPPRVSYDIRRSLGERGGSASGAKSAKPLRCPAAFGDRQHLAEDGADDVY